MGDLVIIGSCNGKIHAIDRTTGKARWVYDAAAEGRRCEFHGLPATVGGAMLIGSDDREPGGIGHVYAFEPSTGKLLWKHRTGRGVMGDIIVAGGRAYVVAVDDAVECLDLASGAAVWSAVPPTGDAAIASGNPGARRFNGSSPVVFGGRVFATSRAGRVVALDADSGARVWELDVKEETVWPLRLIDRELYLGTLSGSIVRIDPASGSLTGRLALGAPVFGPVVEAGDRLIALIAAEENGNSRAVGVDRALTRVLWTRAIPGGWSSARAWIWRGALLLGGEHGDLMAASIEDGSPLWTQNFRGVIRGIGGDGDTLYVGTLSGTVYAFRHQR